MKVFYRDRIKQAVFENSCDCLIYGYGFEYLNSCGLPEAEAKEIWTKAKKYLSEC